MCIGFAFFPTVAKCRHTTIKTKYVNLSLSRTTKLVAMATSLDGSSSNFSCSNIFHRRCKRTNPRCDPSTHCRMIGQHLKKRKSSVKNQPVGGIAMPPGGLII